MDGEAKVVKARPRDTFPENSFLMTEDPFYRGECSDHYCQALTNTPLFQQICETIANVVPEHGQSSLWVPSRL